MGASPALRPVRSDTRALPPIPNPDPLGRPPPPSTPPRLLRPPRLLDPTQHSPAQLCSAPLHLAAAAAGASFVRPTSAAAAAAAIPDFLVCERRCAGEHWRFCLLLPGRLPACLVRPGGAEGGCLSACSRLFPKSPRRRRGEEGRFPLALPGTALYPRRQPLLEDEPPPPPPQLPRKKVPPRSRWEGAGWGPGGAPERLAAPCSSRAPSGVSEPQSSAAPRRPPPGGLPRPRPGVALRITFPTPTRE